MITTEIAKDVQDCLNIQQAINSDDEAPEVVKIVAGYAATVAAGCLLSLLQQEEV